MNLTEQIFEFAKRDSDGLYSISVIENGENRTFKRVLSNNSNNVFSVAKAFTLTALGMLRDDGKLELSETISDIFRDEMPEGYDKKWDRVTVENVIMHRIGLSEGFLDIDVEDTSGYKEKYGTDTDYLKIVLSHDIPLEPGDRFCYSDAGYYLLSRVVTKKSGERLDDFLMKRLFVPLGFAEMAWAHCPMGYAMGATGLFIRTSDIAKLALTYLDRGLYRGRRIFSEDWYETVVAHGYEFSRSGSGYGKAGLFGQYIYFNPELGIAVGWEGHEISQYHGRLCDFIGSLKK